MKDAKFRQDVGKEMSFVEIDCTETVKSKKRNGNVTKINLVRIFMIQYSTFIFYKPISIKNSWKYVSYKTNCS